ncbi:DUF58 domain-containing protein [Derxia lacustris]|uniref:DUF58 domain-containing protein n=1 Tax=Derxia lacustris TaxID=764842 RepID=UPI000A16E7FE|nr:DUF58 domain-containing protein [Derxia lacustris]
MSAPPVDHDSVGAALRRAAAGHGLRDRMQRLLQRPAEAELLLGHRRIYTLPTRPGWAFGALLAALLLLAINYELNLGYALVFILASAAWASLHLGFANLSGLKLADARAEPVFAGELAAFEFTVADTRRRARHALAVSSADGRMRLQLAAGASARAIVQRRAEQRGWLDAPRATLETGFPLGLWRIWSLWQPAARCLVYPAPERPAAPLPGAESRDGDQPVGGPGHESFAHLRAYQPGDSPRRIAWRAYARSGGQTLSARQFEGSNGGELWFDAASLPGALGLEGRLARLAAWVLEADALGLSYGLRLGAEEVPPAAGPAQRDACLRLLALHAL